MKAVLTIALAIVSMHLFGQAKDMPATDKFTITGKVKREATITLADLNAFPQQKIRNVKLTNHKGESKGLLTKLKGVPILEVLKTIEIDCENPKLLSEFYFVFEASDGYKVVYSWNEVFNSEVGKNTFIVTQKDGEKLEGMAGRILAITPKDTQTGRRYIKGLSRITIKRAE